MEQIQTYISKLSGLAFPEAVTFLSQSAGFRLVFTSSLGQEDQVLTEQIARFKLPVKIVTLDTGRLFYETYELLEKTTLRYKLPIEVFYPNALELQNFVNQTGINSFYESVENRKACCYHRKVEPLNRALAGFDVWITGLRADQTEHRKDIPVLEWLEDRKMLKFNPLINWSYEEILAYLQAHNVPYNPLHDKGFISIGCAPCTRAIEPGELPRAGRWWWEASQKECGLHVREPKEKIIEVK